MTDNGVSKKLFITVICVEAITQLADGADDKWPYAIMICCIFAAYKGVQGFIDWKK